MFQGIFKSAINDANKNYIFGTGSIPIQIKSAQLATFADGTTKQQGYQVAEVNKLISTMLTGWDKDGNKPKSMSDNYLELILSCDNGFVVKKKLQFPHIIAWQDDSTPYNIADVYKEFSIDNWLKADDFENPDITLVIEPTDEILTTDTSVPVEATTTNSGRFYLYYRNLPVGVNRIHIDFHIKTKTEPIDFDLEVIDGMSWKDAQIILASNEQAKINVLLSTAKDVYKYTGAEGNFEEITMYEWSSLYQQIISLKPNNKFTHDLYFYLYEESELNTKITELEDKTLDFSVTEGQEIPTSTKISIQKSAGQYVAFELKSDVDISSFDVVYIKPTGGSSVPLKGRLRTNTKYYLQLPEDIVSLAVYAIASSVKGSGDATFVVYGEIGSVDAKYGQETIKNNIVLESLIDKKTIGIVPFQNGSYLDKNGELVEDNLGYYSDYIPVTQGDKFKYSGKNLYSTPCIYVILDMYKRVLSYNNNTGTFSDLEVEIEDASAAYIRFGSYELAPSAERVYLDSAKNYIDEKIADVNSKLPERDVRPKHLYNLFDPSTAIIGKYAKPQDGTLDNSASNVASGYIEVINGESYSFPVDKSLFGSSLAAQIAMYNASKTFIGVVTGTYAEDNSNILTIVINDANCKYIRTTAVKQTSRDKAKWQTGYDTYMVINSDTYPTRYYPYGEIPQYLDGEFSVENNSLVNPLFGKSVIFDGDSICAANDDTNKLGWAGRIANRNRMMWNNFAVGGGTFTKIAGKHVISETDYGNANPDYIIIEGGTNDADNIGSIIGGSIPEQYGSYLPTGYTDEFSTSTYCGAIEYLFKRLLSKYPKAKIGVIIAPKMGVSNDYTPTGNNRRAYFETLIKLCEKWGIPYINLWDRGRLNPRLSAYYTADDPNSCYTDGQHLTPNGYDVITPIIEEWMKTL